MRQHSRQDTVPSARFHRSAADRRRSSQRAHFRPDVVGDLFYNGVASDVARGSGSGGLQRDTSAAVDNATGYASAAPLSGATGARRPPTPSSRSTARAIRPEHLSASRTTEETQLGLRVNNVREATKTTTRHAGYARYFTPPPLENTRNSEIARYAGTSNEAAQTLNDRVKAERPHSFLPCRTHRDAHREKPAARPVGLRQRDRHPVSYPRRRRHRCERRPIRRTVRHLRLPGHHLLKNADTPPGGASAAAERISSARIRRQAGATGKRRRK